MAWRIEDSLNRSDWYSLTQGALTVRLQSEIRRISSPLGADLRLGWWPYVAKVEAGERGDIGTFVRCMGPCDIDHHAFRVTNLRFDVAIRSI